MNVLRRGLSAFALFLGLISGAAYAASGYYERGDYREFYLLNHSLANGASVSAHFRDIAAFDKLDFKVNTSTGNITTANVSWRLPSGATQLTSGTLTSGTPTTSFKSGHVIVTLTNGTGSAITVTGNVLIINN